VLFRSLTGRIVRFAVWVRDQLPANASDQDCMTLFEQAAKVFLFSGSNDGSVRAQIAENKQGERGVLVTANVKAEFAGTPFHMAFTLPLVR